MRPKTKKLTIYVAMAQGGSWNAVGWNMWGNSRFAKDVAKEGLDDEERPYVLYQVEVTVPVPDFSVKKLKSKVVKTSRKRH